MAIGKMVGLPSQHLTTVKFVFTLEVLRDIHISADVAGERRLGSVDGIGGSSEST